MNNYPPGVTGLEPEIAGYPERDFKGELTCGGCEVTAIIECTEYRVGGERIIDWDCATCDTENQTVIEVDDDPDTLRDRANDERYS